METLKIGAVCSLSNPFELEKNLERISFFCKEAARNGCSFVIFPEMNISGYTTGKDLENSALKIDRELEEKLGKISLGNNISYLCGLAEKTDRHIYAAHLYIHNGKIQGKYRKLQPGPPEIQITPGDKIPLFEFEEWKFGVQLCFDSHFPEISTYMAKKGADLIIIAHASPRGTSDDKYNSWKRHLTARAYDNGVYLIANNQCGLNKKGVYFPGISLLISPAGKIVKKSLEDREGITFFELSKKEISDVKDHRMKNFLKYRRDQFYSKLFHE